MRYAVRKKASGSRADGNIIGAEHGRIPTSGMENEGFLKEN
jgi:hypothetical protein